MTGRRAAFGAEDECADALLGEWACSTLNGIPGVGQVYGYLGDVQRDKAAQVADAWADRMPDNFIEEWARGLAEATVSLLAYLQALGERVTRPAFDQDWWVGQYATSFGLSLALLAVLLVWITGRFAASGSSFTAMDLLRQSGWRAALVVPLISAGPLLLLELQLASGELARVFADRGKEHAGGAVERLMDLLVEEAGVWGVFGGTVLALLLFLCVICLGLVTLIEMTIAQWGLHLASLLVPLVLVSWVYPPWSGALKRLAGLIGGLMLLPAFVYFFFHTIWAAFDAVVADEAGEDGLGLLLFLVVGLLMVDAFPLVAMWLMSLSVPGGSGLDPEVRGTVPHPSGGELAAGLAERFEERAGRIGAGDAGGAPSEGEAPAERERGRGGGAEAAGQAAVAASSGGAGTVAVAADRATDERAEDPPDVPAGDPGRGGGPTDANDVGSAPDAGHTSQDPTATAHTDARHPAETDPSQAPEDQR